MNAAQQLIDLDDAEALLAADRDGLLRAASMAGAQVRATAAAVEEGDLDSLRADQPPRTLVWVAGRGTAERAGAMLAAALGGSVAAPIVVTPDAPPWIGALDVLILAGDDPSDPSLVSAAATAVRRGARVVVAGPFEGPLRDATAGRAVVLAPRLVVPDDFGLAHYLGAGLATLRVVDPAFQVDLATLADDLDAEALRNSAERELFTNPAKNLAQRMSGHEVVLAGDTAATLALARHGAAMLLRIALRPVAAVGLADALVALHAGMGADTGAEPDLFHDEQIDGPLPARVRTFVLATDNVRPVVVARVGHLGEVEVIAAEDVPDVKVEVSSGHPEQQLAMMAVRLEMTAVYQRLVRG